MVQDLFDMSRVLSSKLEQLPDPFLNTAPWYDVAYRFPDTWRALVKLYMSKRVDMDRSATDGDPSDVGQQQLDEEDFVYRCSVVLQLIRHTSMAGWTGHVDMLGGHRVPCAMVRIGRA